MFKKYDLGNEEWKNCMVMRRQSKGLCFTKWIIDQNVICFHNLIVYHSSSDILGEKFKNIFAEPNIIGLHGAYILIELGWRAHDKLVMIHTHTKKWKCYWLMVQRVTGRLFYMWLDRKNLPGDLFSSLKLRSDDLC